MPFINTITSTTISRKQETILKDALGKAIELIPGKTEKGLMLAFTPETKMTIRGENTEPIAYIEVSLFGEQPREIIDIFNRELTNIFSEVLAVETKNIYITFHFVSEWGCGGKLL